ncbi:hypothetical protein HUJ04_011099 [Dendroctonus ponderosae]|nr:hypothetical protein HUJ04_011099 [Dendroctonus ponderosae]
MTALTLISVVLYSTAMILIIELDALFIPKRMDPVLSARERIILDPKKRPFCNAFTEPSVEDLSRQIMSEAKLWEAIQEANLELKKHKNRPMLPSDFSDDVSMADRGAISTCALPPCYI